MIAAAHLAMGAAAGLWGAKAVSGLIDSDSEWVRTVVQVGSAFVAGTATHLMLDAVPHNEGMYNTFMGKWPVLATELVIIFNLIFWLCSTKELSYLVIFFGMAGGAWLDFVHLMLDAGFPNNFLLSTAMDVHSYFHSQHTPGPVPSLPIQILVAVLALALLF